MSGKSSFFIVFAEMGPFVCIVRTIFWFFLKWDHDIHVASPGLFCQGAVLGMV